MELVLAELVVDGNPDVVRSGLRSSYNVVHVLGNGIIQPAEDALVDNLPIWIAALERGWRGRDVGDKAELAKEGVEEAGAIHHSWAWRAEGPQECDS